MDIIIREYINLIKCYDNKNKFIEINTIEGINLNDEKIKRFIYSTGTYKNLGGFQHFKYPNVLTYDLLIGDRSQGNSAKEIESTELIQHIEKCLSKVSKKLPHESRRKLGDIISEIKANAVDHSTLKFSYSISYFENDISENDNVGIIQFVIFNFGETIYEHLNNPDYCKNQDIINDMRNLSSKFIKKGLQGWITNEFEEETLWTLYALQDGVSCLSSHRGNGTIGFIENFLDLKTNDHEGTSKMTLHSGNTKILFDGTHKTFPVLIDGDEYKRITFNKEKELNEKPDKKFVKFAPHFFPGTIIYGKILVRENDLSYEASKN